MTSLLNNCTKYCIFKIIIYAFINNFFNLTSRAETPVCISHMATPYACIDILGILCALCDLSVSLSFAPCKISFLTGSACAHAN